MAAFDYLIRNGSVALPGEVRKLDVGVRGGRIAALGERLPDDGAARLFDADGCYVMPGMIDMHVHFNEPNYGHWEGFASGSASLAAGGCTAYADMPLNGNPPTVHVAALAQKARAAQGRSAIDYAFWGGLMPGFLDELPALCEQGVIGFKAFLSNPGGEGEGRFREVDEWTLYEGMKRIAAIGGLLALHAESDAITYQLASAALREGRKGALDYAATRPVIAELEAVTKALLFAKRTGCRLHFVHISSADAVELIDEAKRGGLDVTVETCPHYLALTERDMERLGPVAKCAPPLRSGEEVERLWRKVFEGKIDIVASDHSPCPAQLKSVEGRSFFDAWGGISGAQSSLELLFHEGVRKRGLPVSRVAEMTAERPAKRLGLERIKGRIAVGMHADLAILDPGRTYTLTESDLFYRHKHSPYVGKTFSCRNVATFSRGRLVYTAEQGVLLPGGGAWTREGES